jgi:hypothetical protein
VETAVVSSTDRFMEIRNAAGRTVRVEFANAPDICIREESPSLRSGFQAWLTASVG